MFKAFIKEQLEANEMSYADLAKALELQGYSVERQTIGHWATGKRKPPIGKDEFRRALAAALGISAEEMMVKLGWTLPNHERSPQALLAADMIDQLPEEVRDMAVELIDVLAKRYRME